MSDPLAQLVRPVLRGKRAYHVPQPGGIRAKLDANEQSHVLPDEVRAELGRHLATVELNRYPDPTASRLRAVVAAELDVSGDSIVFGNGSDEIIQMLMATFAAPRPGQERATTLFPAPSFAYFPIAAHAVGVEPVEVPLGPRFALDVEATERALASARPNVAFFARPNNPTGTLWPGAQILEWAAAHPDTIFVSDEAYVDYASDSLLPALASQPNLVVMRTLSKLGLAGLRVGFAAMAPELVAEMEKTRPPYNISSLGQAAAVWILEHQRDWLRARCADVVAERERLAAALATRPELDVFPSAANLLFFRVGAAGAGGGARLWQALAERGVLVRAFGDAGPLADCLRVSIGTRAENDLFLSALADSLDGA